MLQQLAAVMVGATLTIPAWATGAQAGGDSAGKVSARADVVSAKIVVDTGPGTACTWRVVTNLTVTNLDSHPTQLTGVDGALGGNPPKWQPGSPADGSGAPPKKAALYADRIPASSVLADAQTTGGAGPSSGQSTGANSEGSASRSAPVGAGPSGPLTGPGADHSSTSQGPPQWSAGNRANGSTSEPGSSGSGPGDDDGNGPTTNSSNPRTPGSSWGDHQKVHVVDTGGIGPGASLGPKEKHTFTHLNVLLDVSCTANQADLVVFVATPQGTGSCKVPFLGTAAAQPTSAVPAGSLGIVGASGVAGLGLLAALGLRHRRAPNRPRT